MPDIFDQVAPDKPAAGASYVVRPSPQASGDIFDQVAARPGAQAQAEPTSARLLQPGDADQATTARARVIATIATTPPSQLADISRQMEQNPPGVPSPTPGQLPAPLPSTSVTGRILDATVGPGTAGANFKPSPWDIVPGVGGARAIIGSSTGNKPILDVSALHAEDVTQNPRARGAIEGASDLAGGLTSPRNLATLVAIPGLAKIPKAGPVLSRLVSAGFSLQMIDNAAQQAPELVKQIKAGDAEGATRSITHMALSWGLGVLAGNHALKGTSGAPSETRQAPAEQQYTSTGQPVRTPETQEKPNAATVEQPEAKPGASTPASFVQEESAGQNAGTEVERPVSQPAAGSQPPAAPQPAATEPAARAAATAQGPVSEPRLPRELAGAKPRFNSGRKSYTLKFDSDLDKAAYITAQKTRSASDQKFVDFVAKHTGMDEAAIRARGGGIKENIKLLASGEEPGELEIPRHDYLWPKPAETATPSTPTAGSGSAQTVSPETEPASPLPQEGVYQQALDIVRQEGKASISVLQRRLRIGFGEASRYVDRMQKEGIVGAAEGHAPRPVLTQPQSGSTIVNPVQPTSASGSPGEPAPAKPAPPPPEQRGPGWVGNIPTSEIQVDAPRFQFKRNVGQGGAGEELREVTKYDPEKAGVTSVWRDPADGKTYVVNGHHRVELAQRTNYPEMTVRYLDAENAQQARIKGALINIAEGRGESTDAAKVFRDSGMTPEDLAAEGVSLKGKIAKEGLALSHLAQPIFDDVIDGTLSPARGAVIGEGVKNPADQVSLYDLMKSRERGGKRLTNDQVGELIRLTNRTATQTHNTGDDARGGLFGAEEMTRSLLPEKAEVSDYVRKQLGTERKLFGAVSSQAAAEKLGEAGNVIKAGENSAVAQRANQGLALYDKLSGSTGTIDTLLDRAAQSIADGEDSNDVKQRTYRAIKAELRAQADQLTGVSQVDAGRAEGLGGQGAREAGGGERNPAGEEVSASASRVPKLSDRGRPFLAGAPDSYHAHEMRLEEHPLDPEDARLATAYVTNPSGIEFVHRMTGAPRDSGGLQIGALHIGPRSAAQVARFARIKARSFEDPPAALLHLARAADAAANAGKSLILSNDLPGLSDEQKRIGLNEEVDHARQSRLHGGSAAEHLTEENSRMITEQTELGQRAVRALYARGYEFRSRGEAAAEVGVRLMRPGRNEEIGLSRAEARSLAAEYVRALRKEHGSVNSREIAKRITSALRRGNEGGGGQPGALPGRPGPEGGGRPRGGTEADTSRPGPRTGADLQRGQLRQEALASGKGAGEQRTLHLFFPDGEEESELAGKRGAEKLLGDQLTAQVRSGMAAKPTKLKPAENRGLFDEEGPEQRGFNFEANRPPQVNAIPPDSKDGDRPSDLFFGSGLGALEPLFREAKAEGDALRVKRNEALKAAKAAEATPGETHAGEAIRHYFTSERDLWAARANQAIDVVTRKILPKIQDREALGIAREYRHRVGELQQMINGTHPIFDGTDSPNPLFDREKVEKARERLLPVMREALRMIADPKPREAAADRVFTNIADKSLREGRAGGWLESRWAPDEYVPHLLHAHGEGEVATAPSTAGRRQGKIGKFFGFGEKRAGPYPTTLHAVFNGITPKTLDPSVEFRIHADSFARARATHLLEAQLDQMGLGKWGDGKHVPAGWVQLAAHSDEFKKHFAVEDPRTGEKPVGHMGLYVPEFIDKALSPITDPDYTAKLPGFAKLRVFQRGLKEAILGLSGYHLLTENAMAAADIGPAGMLKAFRATREGKHFLLNERDLISSGGTTSIQGSTMDAYRDLKPGTIPTRADVVKAYMGYNLGPRQAADAITRLTFDNVQRRFKVVSFALHRDAWVRDNPNATAAQLAEAKKGIASYVNGVYGGLHWENLGWSKACVEAARAALLAPDWTGSNLALGKYALDRGGKFSALGGATTKESAQARLSRAFWTKQFVGGLIGTQMLSLLFSRQLSKRPFQVYMGQDENGEDVYQNLLFRGSAGDAVSFGTKMMEYGIFGGIGAFAQSKSAPVTKLLMHIATRRDDLGREIERPDNSFLANSARGAITTAADLSPVPISLRNLKRQFTDDDASKYLWSEKMLSLFGSQAQHVAPEGMRMTREGLEEKPEDDRSFWEQVTGKRADE
jgi:hypothetical protein